MQNRPAIRCCLLLAALVLSACQPATAPPAPTTRPTPAPSPSSSFAPAPSPQASPVAGLASSACPGSVLYNAARDLVGQQATVRGPVVQVRESLAAAAVPPSVLIDLGESFSNPNRFTIIIRDEDAAKFEPRPERWIGRNVCVTGLVELYELAASTTVTSPSNIRFIP